jgi:hypothetical protein
MLRLGLTAILAFTLGAASAYLCLDPRHWADQTQEVIISHMVAEYCHPAPWSPERYAGRTLAIASVAVAADLGPLAFAEVAKCQLAEYNKSSYAKLLREAQ